MTLSLNLNLNIIYCTEEISQLDLNCVAFAFALRSVGRDPYLQYTFPAPEAEASHVTFIQLLDTQIKVIWNIPKNK